MKKFYWEEILQSPTSVTCRARVPGGWLLNLIATIRGDFEMTTNFVADPDWAWDVGEKQPPIGDF